MTLHSRALLRAALAPLFALLLLTAASAAQPMAGLDWLRGTWSGAGAVHGAPSRATLAVAPVLGDRFVQLDYAFETSGARAFRFEGRALYRPEGEGRWSGQWYDSAGMTRPIRATAEPGMLAAEWGDDASERGRTLYRRIAADRIETIDSVRGADGAWREFARHSYQRVR